MKDKPKFPLCSKYGLTVFKHASVIGVIESVDAEANELALSKAYENGMLEGYKQSQEKMSELRMQVKRAKNKVYSCGNCLTVEAERDGLGMCCRVLEKALGVRKSADLKEIEARVKELKDLEKSGALAERERYENYITTHDLSLWCERERFKKWRINRKAELSKK